MLFYAYSINYILIGYFKKTNSVGIITVKLNTPIHP